MGRSLDSEYSPIFDNMKKWLLFLFLGLVSISQAQVIIITSTQLLDGKSKYRFKERYTEWFTSNIIRYQFDSNLDKYVSDQIRINKTKAIFLPDTTLIKKKIKTKKQRIALADSLITQLLLVLKDTSSVCQSTFSMIHVSHRYEHIYVKYLTRVDTVAFHLSNPKYKESTWRKINQPFTLSTREFNQIVFLMMPEEFLLRDSIKMRF